MSRTKTVSDYDEMDLGELESRHESFNERRGELLTRRRKLEEQRDEGKRDVHRALRLVERELDDLEAEVVEFLPALQDARARQSEEIRRAGRIDELETQIEVLEDVLAFAKALQDAAAEHLEPHLSRTWRSAVIPDAYTSLARQVLPSGARLHLNGSGWTSAGQVVVKLERARQELAELRGRDADA